MKLFTTQQINDIARYTIEHDKISIIDFVERVAEGVAFEIEARWRPGKPVVVFAGCETTERKLSLWHAFCLNMVTNPRFI